MTSTTDELIDKAYEWVSSRNGAYLAKENVLVYYASITGRASDYKWHSLNLAEVVRIIKASTLTFDSTLNVNHVVAACQELGRVYEFGIKSNFDVVEGVFNYFKEADTDLKDSIMDLISTELYESGYGALYKEQVDEMYDGVLKHLKGPRTTASMRNQLMYKYFDRYGYVMRLEKQRVRVNNKLVQAVMLVDKKPKDLIRIEEATFINIRAKIVGALK
jgi:hypothetical protein